MQPRKLLRRVQVHKQNVRYPDFVRLVIALGFRRIGQTGSHEMYEHAINRQARLNLQSVGGEAKPYQINQLLKLVEEYDLRLEDSAE